jgi:hypothetical protein
MNPGSILLLPALLGQARQEWRAWNPPTGDRLATPDAFTERVTWEEPATFFGATIAAAGVFEIARIQLGQTELYVLERLATFLRASRGEVVVITLDGEDPSINTATDGQSTLSWRWHLRFDDQEGTPAALAGGTVADLPVGGIDGISLSWADQRYQWGSRYSQFLRILTAGPGYVRLFIEFDITGNPWTVRFGGLHGGYRQLAGPLGAALAPVVKR